MGEAGGGEERRQGKRGEREAEGRDRENPGLSKRSERHSEKGGLPRRGAGKRQGDGGVRRGVLVAYYVTPLACVNTAAL